MFIGSVFPVSALVQTSGAKVRRLMPVDDASKEPGFAEFRAKLLAAARKNDLRTIMTEIDPKITNGFGGDDGAASFKRHWIENRDGFREELIKVLTHGGSWQRDPESGAKEFVAPYYYYLFPLSGDDARVDEPAENGAVVLGKGVKLFSASDMSSKVLATLDYEIVERLPTAEENAKWTKVRTQGGLTGYVPSQQIGRPMGYRAIFRKAHGRWLMQAFVAGD